MRLRDGQSYIIEYVELYKGKAHKYREVAFCMSHSDGTPNWYGSCSDYANIDHVTQSVKVLAHVNCETLMCTPLTEEK